MKVVRVCFFSVCCKGMVFKVSKRIIAVSWFKIVWSNLIITFSPYFNIVIQKTFCLVMLSKPDHLYTKTSCWSCKLKKDSSYLISVCRDRDSGFISVPCLWHIPWLQRFSFFFFLKQIWTAKQWQETMAQSCLKRKFDHGTKFFVRICCLTTDFYCLHFVF